MRKLEIVEVKEHNLYILKDLDTNEIIELMIEFYGISNPNINDKLLIAYSLTDKRSPFYLQPYAFRPTKKIMPKQVKDLNDKEYIVLNKDSKNIVLKRIYG